MGWRNNWSEYVPVAKRRKMAEEHIKNSRKKGKILSPVLIEGRKIAKTFWGNAWCENLEAYSDFANRLPRGRTYIRNGSVIDLQISKGVVKAQVMGSSLYYVLIEVASMPESKWKVLAKACAGKIDSLIELLRGKFSKAVMEIITQKEKGLFPAPREIKMDCSCPDSAGMCKHIAAVLYGVGSVLDLKPELLFTLRFVDHLDLIASVGTAEALIQNNGDQIKIDDADLSSLFGIEMDLGKTIGLVEKGQTMKKEKGKGKMAEQKKAMSAIDEYLKNMK